MREALLVARREYLERVRSRAFRLSTVLIPMIFAGIFSVGYLSARVSGGAKHIVVVSNDATLAESVRAEFLAAAQADDQSGKDRSSQLIVDVQAPVSENEATALNAEVERKQIDGYLWLDRKHGAIRTRGDLRLSRFG